MPLEDRIFNLIQKILDCQEQKMSVGKACQILCIEIIYETIQSLSILIKSINTKYVDTILFMNKEYTILKEISCDR